MVRHVRPLSEKEIEKELEALFGLDNPENSEDDFEEDDRCDSTDLLHVLEPVNENSPPVVNCGIKLNTAGSTSSRPPLSDRTSSVLSDCTSSLHPTSSHTSCQSPSARVSTQPSQSGQTSPQPSPSEHASPQPSASRLTSAQPSTFGHTSPQPSPSKDGNAPQLSTSRHTSPEPSPSGHTSPDPSSDSEPLSILRNQLRNQAPSESELDDSNEESDDDENEWKKVMWTEERPDPESFDEVPLQASVFFPSRTSPLAYFSRYFCDDVINLIVEQTNLYAAQVNSRNWEPVTTTDIKVLLGMIILMGIHDLPNCDLYWSTDPFFRVDEIGQAMTCKRYKKIMENLHLNDNTQMPTRDNPNYDKLYKVRPLLDLINTACGREAKQSTSQSIDEAMIKFKGRSTLKQYMPLKPIKRGFKVWVRADSTTGYAYQFDIYTGKDNNSPQTGLGTKVVKLLTQSLIEKQIRAHISFDNFFTSYEIMQYLYDNGLHSTATVNSNRADLPSLIKDKNKAKSIQKLDRGEYKWRIKNDVAFIVWKDIKPVSVLTNAFHPSLQAVCKRTMKDGSSKEITCPEALRQYSKRMGGVDRFDQKRGTYAVGRRSKKWWRRIFYFLIDLSITNAYLLYHNSLRVPNPMSNLEFRLALGRGLISNFSTRKRKIESLPNYAAKKKKVTPSQNYQKVIGVPDDIRFSNVGCHMPHEIEGYRRCRLCSTKVKNVRTKIMCSMCLVPLCVFPCFSAFHCA